MEITKKTTIGELIPDGYEISEQTISTNGIHFNLKKTKKDFESYVDLYLFDDVEFKLSDIHLINSYLSTSAINTIKSNILSRTYNKVPFEIKIGLIKFICDDLQLNFNYVLNGFNTGLVSIGMTKFYNIVPIEFMQTIFK
jgi:hypothetical protein